MQKKQLTLVVVSLLVVVLSVSLAWFTTQILGKGKDVSVTSANLQIIFTDSDGALSATDIEPGWSATKTFTVQNNFKETYKYNIVIKDLLNTFTLDYLKYKITSTNNGYNMTDYEVVPKSSTATDTILAKNVTIAKGETQTYTIEFTYVNDKSVDQSADMNKKLSGTLFITEALTKTELLTSIIKENAINENGYRYEGVDPNNYIQMEKKDGTTELWRIIGIFPDGENGEDVIRVRKHYEQNKYPEMVFSEDEYNQWGSSLIFNTIEEVYSVENYKNTVEYNVYLGNFQATSLDNSFTAEREDAIVMSVGLIYPSDYGYATPVTQCERNVTLDRYDTNQCYNNWLFQGSLQEQWLINPFEDSAVNYIISNGIVYYDSTVSSYSYSPVMALKADVVVIGSGTQTDPYVME